VGPLQFACHHPAALFDQPVRAVTQMVLFREVLQLRAERDRPHQQEPGSAEGIHESKPLPFDRADLRRLP
jgi:hypothetical protein